jgi:hypothetical protein
MKANSEGGKLHRQLNFQGKRSKDEGKLHRQLFNFNITSVKITL